METKTILRRYADHYDAIKKIGSYPLSKQLQLSDLGDVKTLKAVSQKCYIDMKKDKYELSVIDYVCLISTWFIFNEAPEEDRKPEKFPKRIGVALIVRTEETRNLLRLFNKRPEFLMDLIGSKDISVYSEMARFWYRFYNRKL